MKLKTELWKHQKECLQHLSGQPNVGLLMQYGTGKTITCLAWLLQWEKVSPGPTLVICKKGNMHTWAEEIDAHLSGATYNLLEGSAARRAALADEDVDFQIINYEGVRVLAEYFRHTMGKYQKVVCDESLAIKDARTKRSQLIYRLFSKAAHKAILCGKIVSESLMDMFSQMKFLDRGETFGNSYFAFREKFFTSDPNGWTWWPRHGADLRMAELLSEKCFIKRKKDCLSLPPVVYEKIYIDMTAEQLRVYKKLMKDWVLLVEAEDEKDNVYIEYNHSLAVIAKAQQLCSGFVYDTNGVDDYFIFSAGKCQAVIDLFRETTYKKAVIWCRYTAEINMILIYLEKYGSWPVFTFYGGLPMKQRVCNLRKFVEEVDSKPIMVIQVDCGTGLNELVGADLVVYMSNPFSWDKRDNSEARTHRIGSEQHEKITVVDLVTVLKDRRSKSLDEHLLTVLRGKRKIDIQLQQNLVNFVFEQKKKRRKT